MSIERGWLMKKHLKIIVLSFILVALAIALIITVVVRPKMKAEIVEGEDGVLFSDYFTDNTIRNEWQFDLNGNTVNPIIVNSGLSFSGNGTVPAATLLKYELPNKCDIYFTVVINTRGGDGRDPGVFFNVGEDYGERYQILFSENAVKIKYNATTDVAVKKVDGLREGGAYSFRLARNGADLKLYFNGDSEPCIEFKAMGEFKGFSQAKYFGVINYAQDALFDNLVITDGENLLPVTEIAIDAPDNNSTIEGIGNTLQLNAFINPANSSDRALLWSVDAPEMAEVSQDGLVTAKGYGTVEITAKTRDGSNLICAKKVNITVGKGQTSSETKPSTNRSWILAENSEIVFDVENGRIGVNSTMYVSKSGRIFAIYQVEGDSLPGRLTYSDDDGKTWKASLSAAFSSGKVFEDGERVYAIGSEQQSRNLIIYASDNNGETWSEKSTLDKRNWNATSSDVLVKEKSLYLALDVESSKAVMSGYSGNAAISPILLRAKRGSDLTNVENWTFSEEIAYSDIMTKGTAESVDYIDVPNNYGDSKSVGWSGANLFQIYDSNHVWYDSTMNTYYIYLHGSEGTQNYALLMKVEERRDGKMVPSLVETEYSGKILLFCPMAGGNRQFHITYDAETKLYWQVSNYLDEDERIALYFSKNAFDWSFAGIVAKAEGNVKSYSYPSMIINGNDLLILSAAESSNDSFVTLSRIENFRELVY